MEESKYLEIIKKQQELIDLLLAFNNGNNEIPIPTDNVIKPPTQTQNGILTFDEQGFINYLNKKARSEDTVKSYVTQVRLYFEQFKALTDDDLEKYEAYIQKFSPKSINLKICALNSYMKFTNFNDYKFARVKEPQKSFCDNVISDEQYRKLLKWAKMNSLQVYKIAKVIGSTGVRISELVNLKTADLDVGYTDLIGKGNKQRRIFYPKALVDEIKPLCDGEYIVMNRYGQQITRGGVGQCIAKAAEKAGIPRKVMHPHSFRHFFAKQFLKETNDISLLGDILGHSDISTTAIYTRLSAKEQLSEINKIFNW